MRLLNTISFELKDFLDESIPKYAILSHTWGEEEIIFQDLQVRVDFWKTKKSFKKVWGFCSLANDNGYEWCWIDTCCIDKTSSAELSEAINSMFRWYAESHVCFAYLADVQVDHSEPAKLDGFETSRWHKRGWTLQELLAPERVEFYDLDWNLCGTRFSLQQRISKITGIRAEVLTTKFNVEASQNYYCVAEKMSWAANRKTSRVEDLAYCLLGLFDVNMPLLYGEGNRAFERLQFQILAETEDLTLFAWKGLGKNPEYWEEDDYWYTSNHLLAKLPSYFSNATNTYTYQSLDAGSYNRVWEDLNSAVTGPNSAAKTGFVPDQPAKRLGTMVLSIASLPDPKNSSKEVLILCKIPRREDSTRRKYLCLPVYFHKGSALYTKNGLPMPYQIEQRDLSSDVHFIKRISIQLKPERRRRRLYEFRQDINRPRTVILSFQGQGSSSTQILLHDGANPSAVLLRHGSTEAVILYGWHQAVSVGNFENAAWTVATDWEGLPDVRNLAHTEENKRNAGDFSQYRLSSGAHVSCTVKPGVPEWSLSRKNTMSEMHFRTLVGRGGLFSLDVLVKSAEGRNERIEYLGSKEFSDYSRLGDWMEELNPKPRDVLLANPQWQREVKKN